MRSTQYLVPTQPVWAQSDGALANQICIQKRTLTGLRDALSAMRQHQYMYFCQSSFCLDCDNMANAT